MLIFLWEFIYKIMILKFSPVPLSLSKQNRIFLRGHRNIISPVGDSKNVSVYRDEDHLGSVWDYIIKVFF